MNQVCLRYKRGGNLVLLVYVCGHIVWLCLIADEVINQYTIYTFCQSECDSNSRLRLCSNVGKLSLMETEHDMGDLKNSSNQRNKDTRLPTPSMCKFLGRAAKAEQFFFKFLSWE